MGGLAGSDGLVGDVASTAPLFAGCAVRTGGSAVLTALEMGGLVGLGGLVVGVDTSARLGRGGGVVRGGLSAVLRSRGGGGAGRLGGGASTDLLASAGWDAVVCLDGGGRVGGVLWNLTSTVGGGVFWCSIASGRIHLRVVSCSAATSTPGWELAAGGPAFSVEGGGVGAGGVLSLWGMRATFVRELISVGYGQQDLPS